MNSLTPEASQIILIRNPYSSKAAEVDAVVEILKNSILAKDFRVENTQYSKAVDNIDYLSEVIEDGDVVLACGGDGSAHTAGGAINQRGGNALLVPLPFGNANDISYSAYGNFRVKPGNLIRLLSDGKSESFGGIKVSSDKSERVRCALGYASVGLSAETAIRMGHPDLRVKRNKCGDALSLMHEMTEVIRTVHSAQTFEYTENGNDKSTYSIDFVTAMRMAKVLYFKHAKNGKQMSNVETSDGSNLLGRVVWRGIQGITHQIRGDIITERTLTARTPTTIQFDGETEPVSANTTLSFNHEPELIDLLIPSAA